MSKLYIKNKFKKNSKYKKIIFIFIFSIALSTTFNYLLNKNVKFNSERLTNILLNSSNIKANNKNNNLDVLSLLNIKYVNDYKGNKTNPYEKVKKVLLDTKLEKNDNDNYIVYIYNTHDKEEYLSLEMVNNTINPTVSINNYIIKDYLDKNNIKTLVEERSIKDILDINNWKYNMSYKASRMYLEDVNKIYSTIRYNIDIHRDSLSKDKTTISIDNKNYAKVLFLIGLENENYLENLEWTNKINDLINMKYPGLSKGILQKGGVGVNGVYNQDFSNRTILIEIGGEENNIEEVMNTSLAIAECLKEAIINDGK